MTCGQAQGLEIRGREEGSLLLGGWKEPGKMSRAGAVREDQAGTVVGEKPGGFRLTR